MVADTFNPNPAVLEWARRRVGLDETEAAQRLRISVAELRDIESGTPPGIGLVRRMATAYRVQLLTLLLPEIPTDEPNVPTDYRTVQGRAPRLSPETMFAIFDSLERHALLIDLFAENPDLGTEPVIPRAEQGATPSTLAQLVEQDLALPPMIN